MVHLEDFRAIPIEDAALATRWVLWHEESGPHQLDAVVLGGRRYARVQSCTGRPTFDRFIGNRLSFHNVNTNYLSAPLTDAPEAGPALLAACIATLEAAYQPSPLRLRAGRTEEDLRAYLKAFHIIAEEICYPCPVNGIACAWNPDLPIRSWAERQPKVVPPMDAWVVLEDIGEWFAPHSMSGTEDLNNLDQDGKPTPAILDAEEDFEELSAHELVAHHQLFVDFYNLAAAELGLTEDDVAERLRLLSHPYNRRTR